MREREKAQLEQHVVLHLIYGYSITLPFQEGVNTQLLLRRWSVAPLKLAGFHFGN